ncbi:CLUMA_CG016045, isoform A [Clunio marinus]|uniref:CLUMA_CG016045, isoform A n=1 Tax=Clunio marinus TaxID=568069 RepID=A0A1J1ISV2_9DIPT|nr:CLUMA_CG016045, isoform A [Clunio marinus]
MQQMLLLFWKNHHNNRTIWSFRLSFLYNEKPVGLREKRGNREKKINVSIKFYQQTTISEVGREKILQRRHEMREKVKELELVVRSEKGSSTHKTIICLPRIWDDKKYKRMYNVAYELAHVGRRVGLREMLADFEIGKDRDHDL